jgi:UDP-2,4-diacetamido-2,4,6-trideoxy-beta-L-altropyranose hydrolase
VDETTLLIRADANLAMGTGHVMRCLALAQAWQDAGGRATFAMIEPSLPIRERLQKESLEISLISASPGTKEDASQTVALAREHTASWVVVDGYQFRMEYQRALKSADCAVLFVDDYGHASCYCADMVLDQNVSVDESDYQKREPHTQLLIGSQYCLLRREFDAWREWRREIAPLGHRVLVTMGGSDPENFTETAVAALALLEKEFEAIVVLGGSNARPELLTCNPSGIAQKKNIEVRRDVSNMAELMAWADIAISAAGTTSWEMCFLGLPALLVDLAENQTPIAQELDRRGCAIHVGSARDVSPEKLAERMQSLLRSNEDRQAMSSRGRDLVDGRGAARVVAALRRGPVRLRPAQENDCRLLWEWANDSQVREAAFSSAPIPWDQHLAWFTTKMCDANCRILIAENGQGRAIGQFRVNWHSVEDADIDFSVAKKCRGSGYGKVLIELGVKQVFRERPVARLHAFVKPENRASRRSFELARFQSLGEELVDGHTAIHYVRTNMSDRS